MIFWKKLIAVAALSAMLVLSYVGAAIGAISLEEASKLGTTLTGIGAEKGGNADGSIPPYTGGLTTPPRGFKKNSGVYVDPFAGENPLFSINAGNMNQYADKLTEGVKAMMKMYPDFRIDVYETHRTVAFPQFVVDNTKKVALTAKLAKGGEDLENAHGGFPFPIPKSGLEVMWNHQSVDKAKDAVAQQFESYNIDSHGKPSLSLQALFTWEYPYYDANRKAGDWQAILCRADYQGPPRRDGEKVVLAWPLDWTDKPNWALSYLPGQRRVRLAPDICCDTPNPGTAGASCYDDTLVFSGRFDRFNWKLIGKKEVYIPYNAYKYVYYRGDVNKVLLPRFVNPDFIRWELHRVWIVEATLKPGKRHVYAKRILYVDEDSWLAEMADNFDRRGNLYRVSMAYEAPSYDQPVPFDFAITFYDLISHTYAVNMWPRMPGGVKYIPKRGAKFYTPDALIGGGVR